MLKEYRAKRDFKKTAEPDSAGRPGKGALTFVIQEHHASRLHWDFRLECDGVLKSWAVPKGPSTDPTVKRLAVMVEDHPLAYGTFHGTIPKGEYGGGEVIIWDHGTYAPDEPKLEWSRSEGTKLVREGLRGGKLSFTLLGERLHGSWALVRMRDSENWLLIKHRDAFAEPEEPVPAIQHEQVKPMLATEIDAPFDDKGWAFEPKLDGIRVLAYVTEGKVSLVSRGELEIADRFPAVAEALRKLEQKELTLDGEIVVFDACGKPDFEAVMAQYHAKRSGNETYIVFDLLRLGEKDLASASYAMRRAELEKLDFADSHVRIIDSFAESGMEVYSNAIQLGFEGVIAKRLAAPYRAGRRSADWKKIKRDHTEDFFIVGWRGGNGHREGSFGALLLASEKDGELVYRGNVGGGFGDSELENIKNRLGELETQEPSPAHVPKLSGPIHWVQPILTAEVKFMSTTKSGHLRFPRFIKMRSPVEKPLSKPTILEEDEGLIDQLAKTGENLTLHIAGHKLELTHLEKTLWPQSDLGSTITKRELLLHYAKVAPYLLPHLKDRPLAFVRYPNGLEGPHFFQKHLADGAPDFLKTVEVYSDSNHHAVAYLLVDSLPSLLWLAQMGALEIHPWQSRITKAIGVGTDYTTARSLDKSVLDRPDFLILDLDPYIYSGQEATGAEPELNKQGWKQVVEVAERLRESLDQLNYISFVKTSGKTGLHIFVPVERIYPYDEVRAMAKTLGEHLMLRHPDLITMEWSVKKRPAKVYFDFGQNVMGKTLAAIYSTRPTPGALVSFPLQWDELKDVYPTDFSVVTVPKLLAERGDIWRDILDKAQRLV